jgi:hypothetical protein
MKKLLIIFAVVLFTAGFASKVSAQGPGGVVAYNQAGGEIMAPLTLDATSNLEFGSLAVKATGDGGTVVITPTETLGESFTGDVTLMTGGNIRKAAKYHVTGEAGYTYSITVPLDGVVTITSGGNSMAVKTFLFASDNNSTLVGGQDDFYVGATLVIPAAQAVGVYTGQFEVKINY